MCCLADHVIRSNYPASGPGTVTGGGGAPVTVTHPLRYQNKYFEGGFEVLYSSDADLYVLESLNHICRTFHCFGRFPQQFQQTPPSNPCCYELVSQLLNGEELFILTEHKARILTREGYCQEANNQWSLPRLFFSGKDY